MSSDLRSILFRLLSSLSILRNLNEALQRHSQLTDEDRAHITESISFLEQIKQDTLRYVGGEKISDNQKGLVFANFLVALALTEDHRLSKGAAYAVENVPLDSTGWSRLIGHFDDKQEKRVIEQLTGWSILLGDFLEGKESESPSASLSGMIRQFERTADLLERSIMNS